MTLALAPMAGITDQVFRRLCFENGCDAATTEMVSAQGYLTAPPDRNAYRFLLARYPDEGPLAVQIFGSDPGFMAQAAARLSEQVRTHEMYREYVCVAEGEPPQRFHLTDYLKKDEEANMVRVIPDYLKAEGKLAILNGVNLRQVDGRSLCAIKLETGRAHQIRVQMAHSGHPLAGDHRYGRPEGKEQIALYGLRLTLTHPTTRERMVFMAPLPENPLFKPFERDLRGLLNTWPKIGE